MRKARVLHVLPNFGPGGAERMTTHLLLRLNGERFEVAAVSLFDRQGTELEDMLDRAGVRVWYLGKRLGFDPRMYWRLGVVFREFQPDVVHTHLYVLRYLLPFVLTRRARAWVHTVHNVAEKEVDRMGKGVHRMAFRLGVVPVAIAEGVARSLERVYGLKNPPLIPNGIPVADYALGEEAGKAWRGREGYEEGDVLLVSVARMSPQKDPFSLIQAFSIATSHNGRLRLLLVGDGPLRRELEDRVKALGLEDRVRFLGLRTDVPEILAAADAFILSSRWEGNPLSVMEAMAAGKPVIATAVGGVPELVQDGKSGVLVPPGDVEALAEAILRLAGDVHLRRQLGQEAFKQARERFDVSVMVKGYETLYEVLLEKR
ncbi:glycosyltransferase [Thermus scotoductus]|uniref:glycosyltransferase n=1 Tax=Thermus scotoductus TaxID=37636 RepID=UPI00242F3971|nr:glycosyltransferase [Thermus scotoductus]